MMKKYYELLTTDILIKASDLIPKINDRTLLYGFDNDTKEKFHVFFEGSGDLRFPWYKTGQDQT